MFLGLDRYLQILDVFVQKNEISEYLLIILPIVFGLISLVALFIIIKTHKPIKKDTWHNLKRVFTFVILFFILIIASNSDKKFDVVTIELYNPIKKDMNNNIDYDSEELTEKTSNLVNVINSTENNTSVTQLETTHINENNNEIAISTYDKSSGLNYYLHSSNKTKDGLPLVIFLHGKSETGSLARAKELKPVKSVTDGTLDGLEDFVFLAPASPRGTLWVSNSALDKLMVLIPKIVEEYNIDTNRIYLTGFSAGGMAVWSLVNKYPNMFKAAVTVSGTLTINPDNFVNTPIYAICGSYESSYIGGMRKNVNLINNAGGEAIFKTIPKAGHSLTQSSYTTKELYDWLLSK